VEAIHCLSVMGGEGTFTSFFKDESQKEVTKQYKSRFFSLFLLNDRRIRIRIHTSVQLIRIQEAQKHVDDGSATLIFTILKQFKNLFFQSLD
jgi:hypothetical protein